MHSARVGRIVLLLKEQQRQSGPVSRSQSVLSKALFTVAGIVDMMSYGPFGRSRCSFISIMANMRARIYLEEDTLEGGVEPFDIN